MPYSHPNGDLRQAFLDLSGLPQVWFTNFPFELAVAPGVDWADYLTQPDDEEGNPVAPVRAPRPVWDWYLQEFPGLAAEPPSEADVASWVRDPDPEPAPVTGADPLAEGVALYKRANEAAREIIFVLMTKIAGLLIHFGVCTPENVNDTGADFVAFHNIEITNFERSGRNAKSALALYNAVAGPASRSAFEWLDLNPAFLAVFAAELGVTPDP